MAKYSRKFALARETQGRCTLCFGLSRLKTSAIGCMVSKPETRCSVELSVQRDARIVFQVVDVSNVP